jgi:hypothetical protein
MPQPHSFALDRYNPDSDAPNKWVRCKLPRGQGPAKWVIQKGVDAAEVARQLFGAGTFRVAVYDLAGQRIGHLPQFEVTDGAAPTPTAPAPPPKNGNGVPSAAAPFQGFAIPPGAIDPSAQFALVYQMVSQTMALQFQAIERAHAAQMAAATKSADMNVQLVTSFMKETRQLEREAREAMAEGKDERAVRPILDRLDRIDERIEELDEDDDDEPETRGEQAAAALMKFSESPTEIERVTVGFVNAINALANSPLGAALAEGLRKRLVGAVAGEESDGT